MSLDKSTLQLIAEDNFYANFLVELTKEYDNSVPTAYCNTKQKKLGFNKDFMELQVFETQTAVMLHELLHYIMSHDSRYHLWKKETQTDTNAVHNIANVAMDIAINNLIKNLPLIVKYTNKDGQIEETQLACYDNVKLQYPDLKPDESFEYYFNYLLQKRKDNDKGNYSGKGDGKSDYDPKGVKDWTKSHSMDIHEFLQEASDEEKELFKKKMEEAIGKHRGTVPGESLELYKDLCKSKVNWRNELKKFVSRVTDATKEESKKRRNRRYPFPIPGHKRLRKAKLLVGIDESGSVSPEMLKRFATELNAIHKNNVEVVVVTADYQLTGSYKYDPKKGLVCKGRGGTSFIPFFEEAKNHRDITGIIVMSDMENCDEGIKRPGVPVLWLSTTEHKSPYNWGSNVRVEL